MWLRTLPMSPTEEMLELKVSSKSYLSAALTSALTVRFKVLLLMHQPKIWGASQAVPSGSPPYKEGGMRNSGTLLTEESGWRM